MEMAINEEPQVECAIPLGCFDKMRQEGIGKDETETR